MELLLPKAFSGASIPSSMNAHFFDAEYDDLPETPEIIDIYVPTYMGANRAYEVIDYLPNLKYILLLTAGVDKALPYIRPGVTMCNARGVHDGPTAELTLALALASYRNLANFIRAKNDAWSLRKPSPTLHGANVVIIGAGSIGQEISRLFLAFGAQTHLVSRTAHDGVTPLNQAETMINEADIVVVVVPLTEETTNLIDSKFLASLKNGALLINVARGEVLDTEALVVELSQERISAALDVTNPEPLPKDHPLWDLNNCIISPHVGGATDSFFPRAQKLLEQNLHLIAGGREPQFVINGDY